MTLTFMTNPQDQLLQSYIANPPPVLDLRALAQNYKIGRTVAYQLASSGEIESLTLGAPGKRGKRVFLTQSVVAYLSRRLAASRPLNCVAKSEGETVAAASESGT